MSTVRYKALSPLLSGEGSRAFLGLMLAEKAAAKPVVLIWVPADVSRDPEQSGQLAKETLRASILEHPNIIHVYGLASLAEGLARVVEFADGETLRKVLDTTGKFPPLLAAKIAADAAMGLHYAHLAGNDDGTPLVHGDLRPETVMVSFSGAVKVAGYGALSVAPREQGGKRVVFRRRYCAPEQIVGTRDAITIQTDVYLLGLLLYECLTGKMPWNGEEQFDQAVLTQPLPLDSEEISPALAQVIEKATAKRAQERYRTPRELREAIEAAIGEIPGNAALAAQLEHFFPANDSVRAERRALLTRAIAESGATPPPELAGAPPTTSRPPAPVSIPPREAAGTAPASVPPVRSAVGPGPGQASRDVEGSADSRNGAPPAHSALHGAKGSPALATPAPRASAPSERSPSPSASAAPKPPGPSPATATSPASIPAAPAAAPAQKFPFALFTVSLVAAVLAIALVVLGIAWFRQHHAPARVATTQGRTPSAKAATASAGAASAGKPAPPAPAPEEPPAKTASRKPAASKPRGAVVPAHFHRATRPVLPTFELAVTPPVNVRLDGKSIGRTPLSIHVRAGRHRLTLRDHAEGVDVRRIVDVDRNGTDLHIALQRAFVSIDVPTGSKVFVDGQLIAHASVKNHLIYEGHHRVRVMLGMAEWHQEFDVGPREHMSFNVGKIPE